MNIVSQEIQRDTEPSNEQQAYVAPSVDIESTESGYILQAEMPGVDRHGIEVTVENGNLVLTGRRKSLEVTGEPLHSEIRQVTYRRTYELDPSIDAGKITAHIEQGVLTVNLPKAERLKARRIELE